jgi:hypothetical protein
MSNICPCGPLPSHLPPLLFSPILPHPVNALVEAKKKNQSTSRTSPSVSHALANPSSSSFAFEASDAEAERTCPCTAQHPPPSAIVRCCYRRRRPTLTESVASSTGSTTSFYRSAPASSARVAVDAVLQAHLGWRDELRRGHGDDGFVFFLSLSPFPLLTPLLNGYECRGIFRVGIPIEGSDPRSGTGTGRFLLPQARVVTGTGAVLLSREVKDRYGEPERGGVNGSR